HGMGRSGGPHWVQGFSNKNLAFVNNQTLCYPCGNYILFLDIETKKTRAVQCQSGQVGAFAASASSQVVAFSDRQLNPLIHIYTFPELRKLTELKGDAQLDYTLLAFSFKGPYLASYSSIPEFVLSVWNWQENILLCSESQPGLTGTSLSFNPMNWQQLCFVAESSVTIWCIERSKDEHLLTRHPVELPDEQGVMSPHEDLFFPPSRNDDPYYGPDLPISAIAGLEGDEAETFVPRNCIKTSVHPTAHCWTAASEIYMGCKEGYVLAIDAEQYSVSVLQQKAPPGRKPSNLQNPVLLAMAFCNEGLYAAGHEGILIFYHIKDLQYEIKICADISQPISSLIFSPDYTSLLLVTDQGTVYSYRPAHSGEAVQLLDTSSSCFLAADFLTPGNSYCVSVTISGEVQVWSLEDGTFLSKLNLGTEATSMACCPSSKSVAVGTQGGQIYFLDVTKAKAPRVVHRTFLSKLPVLSLHYDQSGQILIARATEGHIFILDARPSKLFQVLGYIVLEDEVLHLSVISDLKNDLVRVTVLLNGAEVQQARLELFSLSSAMITENEKYVNEQGMFNASDLKKKQYDLDYPLSSAVRLKNNIVYGYCSCAPFICKYHLARKGTFGGSSVFSSEEKIPSKQFGSGLLCLSPNSQWLAAGAKDGVLFIYSTSTLDMLGQKHCHSYQGGGIRSMVFSLDGNFILVNGENDCALVCLKWKEIKKTEVEEAALYWQSLRDILNKSTSVENSVLKSMAEWNFDPESTSKSLSVKKFKEAPLKSFNAQVTEEDGDVTNTDDMTWIGQKTQKVMREETLRFANQKEELQMGIRKLCETIQKMMHENEQVPDIEKLELWEFNLDLEEQEQVQAEAEENVARARREIEMEILSYCYLQDLIKFECWDDMCVKERAVKCFHMDCEVRNYPLKERSREELESLKEVLQLKRTADLQAQKKTLDSETALSEEEGEKAAGEVADDGAPLCLNGSLSSQYGGDTSILYHQCDLHTKEQKLNQIILLKDVIYKVKAAFNEEFDIVVQKKEQEIARVKERNLKIQEILEQLDLQVEVWEPVLTDDEMPERVLTVKDSEIKAEKYMTQEEKEQAEMLAKLEMERRLAATDDERLRALDDMMGGVLEIRREDILKMDIPPPDFLSRPEDLWTEKEKKIFEEYENKVKELNEEKEDYRQFLRNEWNKIEVSIKETTQNFDEIVCKLSEKKLKSQMVIYQEELKIVNLIYTLLLDEELDTREAGLHKFLIKKKKEKVKGARKILTAKHAVEACTGPYKEALHGEKSLEHGFMKQFAHTPGNLFEELLQLYKLRPETPNTETLLDTANPYVKESPEDYQDAVSLLMKAMDELDSPEHKPSGLDQSLWEHFCLARRNKMASEELVKWKALALAEMQACLQRRTHENDKMKSELEKTFQELTWLKEEKMKLQQNLIVQFLLKQGQVELGGTQIPEYSDAVLIDRSVVEELNCTLAAQGEKKITAMVEFKDFSKGIIQLEWEHKKMKMQIQDLKEKARDIVMLPISKDCQLFLTVHNYDTHIAQHLAGMEQSLSVMDKLHKKNVKNRQKKVRELKKCIRLKEQENYELSLQLKEMLVSVSERMHIFEAADTRDISERITRQRYREIVKQKYLRNLIREQEKQLAILQSETESWNPGTVHII
ncbi:unnamed protein product, partial [Coccothraustes coccothraustes]